jgi:hypothetical protein
MGTTLSKPTVSKKDNIEFHFHGKCKQVSKTSLIQKSSVFAIILTDQRWKNQPRESAAAGDSATDDHVVPEQCHVFDHNDDHDVTTVDLFLDYMNGATRSMDKDQFIKFINLCDKYDVKLKPDDPNLNKIGYAWTRDESLTILRTCKFLLLNDDYIDELLLKTDEAVWSEINDQDVANNVVHFLNVGSDACLKKIASAYPLLDCRDLYIWASQSTPSRLIKTCSKLGKLRNIKPICVRMDMAVNHMVNMSYDEVAHYGQDVLPYIAQIYIRHETLLGSVFENVIFDAFCQRFRFLNNNQRGNLPSQYEELLVFFLGGTEETLNEDCEIFNTFDERPRYAHILQYFLRCRDFMRIDFTDLIVIDFPDRHLVELDRMFKIFYGQSITRPYYKLKMWETVSNPPK